MATGLLILLLGKGTKLSQRIMGTDKEYAGTLRLGTSTDTQDADGRTTEERPYTSVNLPAIEARFEAHRGDQMQKPPMVSAIKKNGVPLYKLARKGVEVEREDRLIHVYRLQLLDFAPPDVRFDLKCTKGTYVRTLCHDIGEELGCGGHLAALRRTAIGNLHVDQATPLDTLLAGSLAELGEKVIPVYAFTPQ